MPIIRFPSPIKVRHEINRGDGITRIAIDGVRVEYTGRLVGAVGHGRPKVRQRFELAGEGEVDEVADELVLALAGRGVLFADGLAGVFQCLEREGLDEDGEEIALVLGLRCPQGRRRQQSGLGDESC